jgi:hypothetical protein
MAGAAVAPLGVNDVARQHHAARLDAGRFGFGHFVLLLSGVGATRRNNTGSGRPLPTRCPFLTTTSPTVATIETHEGGSADR